VGADKVVDVKNFWGRRECKKRGCCI